MTSKYTRILVINLATASLALATACQTSPEYPGDLYLHDAYVAREAGELDEARTMATLAIEDGRREADAREFLASLHREEARALEAAGEFRRASRAYVLAADVELVLQRRIRDVRSALEMGEKAGLPDRELLDLIERALREEPQNVELHRRAARIAEDLGELDLAQQHYLWLVSANPEDKRSALRLGIVYLELGRANDAAAVLARVYQQDPQNIQAALNLVAAYSVQNRHDDIEEIFEELVRRFPEQPGVLLRYATFEEERGNDERAARLRQRAREHQPAIEEREMRPLR